MDDQRSSVSTVFVTKKRLTDSDLDEEKSCLSIPKEDFNNALQLIPRDLNEVLESGKSLPVIVIVSDGVDQQRGYASMYLRKSEWSYELSGKWNGIKRLNQDTCRGADGLLAVIHLHCFFIGEMIQFIIIRQPEFPERLKKHLETMQDPPEAHFLTIRRLTDSDLDPVVDCLLIPDALLSKDNLFKQQERDFLDLGKRMEVLLLDINDSKPVVTGVELIRKPNQDYALRRQWTQFVTKNAKKLIGIRPLPVIQLWFFRAINSLLYFAPYIVEEAEASESLEGGDSVEATFMTEGKYIVKAVFVTKKRLTDSDLDEENGHLSIPVAKFKNALTLVSRNEMDKIDSGGSVQAKLAECCGGGVDPAKPQTTLLLTKSKSNTNYELSGGGWHKFKRANEEKLKGVDGLHAVIRLFCFRIRSGLCFGFIIVKENEIPETLINRLKSIAGGVSSTPAFLTEKRLTDSELNHDEGCLSIPESVLHNANLFTAQETQSIILGGSLYVGLIYSDHIETKVQLIRKRDKGYVLLSQHWKDAIDRNDKNLVGFDGLHGVIQFWVFRYQSQLYFALNIAEEAKAWDEEATVSDGSGYLGDAETTASDGSG